MYESPAAFAKRMGLTREIVIRYIKSGEIPFIRPGTRNMLVHVEGAQEALALMAKKTAIEQKEQMPVVSMPRPMLLHQETEVIKRPKPAGRPPDSVRLAKKLAEQEKGAGL